MVLIDQVAADLPAKIRDSVAVPQRTIQLDRAYAIAFVVDSSLGRSELLVVRERQGQESVFSD